ncbi:GC-rich sequence DNA-binding factor-like protein-domain-containing protein [Fimicolochytrium jonesii]|uniref:GC-rich sequence DNA-binding factor-like protein-domain-containing protein n=1 Tax=Fimicolochytrium jonesii TaxID=1396493 RepID=UPI0022FDD584|nr:GC-rich sequence DNA-binding factor-like protein-domain-containing protein [Fimicolochytrium jonesii]KAI8825833.1 GC-rich sequence DNA-binding factor-like protein-domain-containing protein [Fimicolochytrium jonesii]
MGRRKNYISDDGDSSGDDERSNGRYPNEEPGVANADLAEEAALFANPYGHGRKRRRGKEDAIYGVFGESDEEGDKARSGGRSGGRGGRGGRYVTGVNFVSAKAPPSRRQDDEDEDEDKDEDEDNEEGRRQEDDDDPMDVDEKPSFGAGLGFASHGDEMEDARPGFGAANGFGLGFGRAGLGASTSNEQNADTDGSSTDFRPTMGSFPTAFGNQKKSKARTETASPRSSPTPAYRAPRQPVDRDFGRFDTSGIAAKMMAKMGYKRGEGLGKYGEGIAAPIDVKLRPTRAGLGLVDERTDAIKKEQREKALQEDDSDEADRTPAPKKEVRTGQWKQNARKPKVAYKSAQELIADQEAVPITTTGATQATKILDMTGREVRELANVSEVASSSAAFDVTAARLPELRHNVRLLADMAQQDLLQIGRQLRIEQTKRKQLENQQEKIALHVEAERKQTVQLKAVMEIANECQTYSKQFTVNFETANLESLVAAFSGPFQKLQTTYFEEYKTYRLDELVVASLTPIVKRLLADWQPLSDPRYGSDAFREWKRLLILPSPSHYVNGGRGEPDIGSGWMSPYESMMYNLWLPKVRQAINNEWDPKHPDAAIALVEAWHLPPTRNNAPVDLDADNDPSVLIPSWLYHNILEQLILPKLVRAIDQWNPAQDPLPVYTWIHPWLPHLADHMEGIFTTIRHKFNVSWRDRKWTPADPSAFETLLPWREIFRPSDMESLVMKAILPKLVETLQKDFSVNPANQDLTPLQNVLTWRPFVPNHLFVHLLETEFFPKWHSVLWTWLCSPGVSGEEITMWYRSWKTQVFPPDLVKETGIAIQFKAGLDMMNRSIEMGGARGPMPAMPPPIAFLSETAAAGGRVSGGAGGRSRMGAPGMSAMDSFKDYVERVASEHDLLFAPINRVHPTTGKALFRLAPASKAIAGTGGIIGYMDEGVLFIEDENGGWKPIGVEEAMSLAAKKKR